MPDIDEENPYDDPNLREAWADGYLARRRGMSLPRDDEQVHDDPDKDLAWLKGYGAAREQSAGD